MKQFNEYGGLVITSPRSLKALEQVSTSVDLIPWLSLPLFIVGDGSLASTSLSFCDVYQGIGNAVSLAEVICEKVDRAIGGKPKPLLFLCGNLRRDELPNILNDRCVAFEELIVYETSGSDDIAVSSLPKPDWVVFFSPSGVDTIKDKCDKSEEYRAILSAKKVRNCGRFYTSSLDALNVWSTLPC
jgi:uroporphyrinogen-III synthase